MLEGAQVTVLLFLIAIVVSIPLGFLLTLAVRSRIKPLSWFANSVYLLAAWYAIITCNCGYGLRFTANSCHRGIFGARSIRRSLHRLYLNYAAYFAEIFRGGLLAIDKGQYEASQVLGLNRWQTTTRVILPQMFRIALPAVANESVTLVKDTALLYAVAVPELLHFAQTAVNRDFTIVPFFFAAIIYLIITLVMTLFFKWLERRFKYD